MKKFNNYKINFNNNINNNIYLSSNIISKFYKENNNRSRCIHKIWKSRKFILTKNIYEVLPYETKFCKFIPIEGIYPDISQKTNYFYIPYPLMDEKTYDKWKNINKANSLLLGPCFVPISWFKFPSNVFWNERRFREILSS